MEALDPKWVRVSSILKMMPTLGEDGNWDYPLQKINPNILERAATRGSSVHSAIAAHMRDEFFAPTKEEQGFFDSFQKWKDSVDLQCHDVETRLYYEPMNLTGCIDMIGKTSSNGIYQVIDFKCTSSPDHCKWPIQGAFYEFLAHVNGMILDKRCLFIQLDPEGDFPKVHEYHITKELTSTAISLYNAYMYLTRK